MSEPIMLTIHELCARYSLRPWTVRQYCSQRRIPHVEVGRKVLFSVEEIEQWLKGQAGGHATRASHEPRAVRIPQKSNAPTSLVGASEPNHGVLTHT
jgi:excisionase family DNA binding protein